MSFMTKTAHPQLTKCPICGGKTEKEETDYYVNIICQSCNLVPTVVNFYSKKRKTDQLKGEINGFNRNNGS